MPSNLIKTKTTLGKRVVSRDGSDSDQNDDENRLDFELLMRRQHSADSTSPSPSRTTSSQSLIPAFNEVWPLYLTTYFVDHYILGDVLGEGAYAEVRECVDTRSLERCSVKIVNKNYLKRQAPNALNNQLQEIKLLKRLKHGNIIKLRETLFKGSKIYIFLEYCSFVLSELLKEQEDSRLPIGITRNLFSQLLNGLEYLHSQNVVHRDIKPQNLLISTSGQLKIIDFGVSQLLSIWSWPSDECENYEGSPLFQAPEVVSGQSKYGGFKVDTWSAGVTLFLLLYGQYPFMDHSLLSLYDKILSEPFEVPVFDIDYRRQEVNENDPILLNDCLLQQQRLVITDLVAQMLDKDATKRCSIAEARQHPWLKLRETQTGSRKCCHGVNGANHLPPPTSNEEHSEFIDLLNHLNRQPTAPPRKHQHHQQQQKQQAKKTSLSRQQSSSNVADDDSRQNSIVSLDSPKSSGGEAGSADDDGDSTEYDDECSSTSSIEKRQQRDIYLSMSVLPYLYSHHFSHVPVVKVSSGSRSGSDTTNSTSSYTSPTSSSRSSPSASCSCSPTSSVRSTSISPSPQQDSDDDDGDQLITPSTRPNTSNNCPHRRNQQNPEIQTSIESGEIRSSSSKVLKFKQTAAAIDSLNPHEMIADKEIEWGTREQYNLLKLPIIRVNRLRSTKKSREIRRGRKKSAKGSPRRGRGRRPRRRRLPNSHN